MRSLAPVVLLLACGGCHMGLLGTAAGASGANRPYRAGALAAELGPGSVRTLGCLDVGFVVAPRQDGPILHAYVGNRCVHAERLDLARLAIVPEVVILEDPRGEIVPLHVGGLEQGHERIRLVLASGIDRLCFGVSALAPDAREARPAPLCFENDGGTWRSKG